VGREHGKKSPFHQKKAKHSVGVSNMSKEPKRKKERALLRRPLYGSKARGTPAGKAKDIRRAIGS